MLYQANSLSQSLASYSYSFSMANRVFAQLPSVSMTDAFGQDIGTSFQQKLATEIKSLREKEAQLKMRIEEAGDSMSQEIRQHIASQYSLIQRAKKMMALLVENMQKTMQNIVANFR